MTHPDGQVRVDDVPSRPHPILRASAVWYDRSHGSVTEMRETGNKIDARLTQAEDNTRPNVVQTKTLAQTSH